MLIFVFEAEGLARCPVCDNWTDNPEIHAAALHGADEASVLIVHPDDA